MPTGGLPPPLVLPTTSMKCVANPAQSRYTSPQQLQSPMPAISLVPDNSTSTVTPQISNPPNNQRFSVSPVGTVDNATTLQRQSPGLQQLQTQHNQSHPNQQRIITNTSHTPSNLIVSPHMVTRTPPGLSAVNSSNMVLPTPNSPLLEAFE